MATVSQHVQLQVYATGMTCTKQHVSKYYINSESTLHLSFSGPNTLASSFFHLKWTNVQLLLLHHILRGLDHWWQCASEHLLLGHQGMLCGRSWFCLSSCCLFQHMQSALEWSSTVLSPWADLGIHSHKRWTCEAKSPEHSVPSAEAFGTPTVLIQAIHPDRLAHQNYDLWEVLENAVLCQLACSHQRWGDLASLLATTEGCLDRLLHRGLDPPENWTISCESIPWQMW